ncbi:DUF4190 domain-containing protein [Amycolatopsis pithecellobii]|uniref:DUF4190 domain-containing protein n=1 Tax=Amycolatopsis pithecellobii TaxID=664692 RepID=A0A6N7YPF6_9PSEU|nr:DUF4190 domain-containing protein [Amycolatopsis pithecellobii]MTD54885.1 hypothetical protein [Amycolatopsis pithecellobii]
MNQPNPYPGGYDQQFYNKQSPRNGLGVSGMVLGIVALVFSFVPVIGVIAWPLSIVGTVLSGVGINYVRTGRADNKGVAIAGLTTSVIALVVCILWVTVFVAAPLGTMSTTR